MMYSNTGVSGSVTGVRSDRQLVLYYWLIPNRNIKDSIIISIGWVGSSCVKGRESIECGGYGRIILGLGGAVCEDTFVCCTGLFGCTAYGGVIPSAV